MRKFTMLFFTIAVCMMLVSAGSATAGNSRFTRQIPNSVVSCYGGPMMIVTSFIAPTSKDVSECEGEWGIICSTCIDSLQSQRCEITNLTTEFIPQLHHDAPNRNMVPSATYLLHCK